MKFFKTYLLIFLFISITSFSFDMLPMNNIYNVDESYIQEAELFIHEGNYSQAEKEYENIIGKIQNEELILSSDHIFIPYSRLAYLKLRQNDLNNALRLLFKSVRLGAHHGEYYNIAYIFHEREDFFLSEEFLIKEYENSKELKISTLNALIELYIFKNDYKNALYFTYKRKNLKNDYKSFYYLGSINYQNKVYSEATRNFEKAYEKNSSKKIFYKLIKAEFFSGNIFYAFNLWNQKYGENFAGNIIRIFVITIIIFIIIIIPLQFFLKFKGRQAGIKDLLLFSFIIICLIIWINFLIYLLMDSTGFPLEIFQLDEMYNIIFQTLFFNIISVLTAFYIIGNLRGKSLKQFFLFRKTRYKYFNCALILSIMFFTVISFMLKFIEMPDIDVFNFTRESLFNFGFTLIFVVLLAPVLEEIVFKGFIYRILSRRFNVICGAVITSIIFALIHMPQYEWWYPLFIVFGAFSFAGCLITQKAKSLYPAIISHMVYNLLIYFL
ncbi:MAG: CPBP family glutamic-type intramembrane protease [Candidatus Muiribacteriota bacterium]